jgi:hypothetical protein
VEDPSPEEWLVESLSDRPNPISTPGVKVNDSRSEPAVDLLAVDGDL